LASKPRWERIEDGRWRLNNGGKNVLAEVRKGPLGWRVFSRGQVHKWSNCGQTFAMAKYSAEVWFVINPVLDKLR